MTRLRTFLLAAVVSGVSLLAVPLGAQAGDANFDTSVIEPLPPVEADFVPAVPDATLCCPPAFTYELGGRARAYYINDQRIEFTGQEATFAVEGVVDGAVYHRVGSWDCTLAGELFLTQPFDRNILVDSPERESFAPNFEIDVVSISQLYLGARQEDVYVALGRFVTPFGRFYYPLYRNNFDDSPFIRSEAVLYRETGLLTQWDPGSWTFTAALTNGGPNQDANSSKALVARAGFDQQWFAAGMSVKLQDGIGSEGQKMYNEHAGVDIMFRRGNWTFSAEAIHDRYGFRQPGYDPLDVFWGRSVYLRDLNKADHRAIVGYGYYLNALYEGPLWTLSLNYGEFYPEQLGIRLHDAPTRRGIIKASRHWTEHLETYGVVMIENDLPDAFAGHARRGIYIIFGGQFVF